MENTIHVDLTPHMEKIQKLFCTSLDDSDPLLDALVELHTQAFADGQTDGMAMAQRRRSC